MTSLMLDAEALYADLRSQMRQLLGTYAPDQSAPHLVGVASGGVWLAERLQHDLGLSAAAGVLSSSMHRDDFAQRGLSASAQTLLPFDVNGANLIVVDDVLYTGRTIRAVLNELFDYGRPASVKLAVLVDRGERELPVQADLVMARVTLPATKTLALAQLDTGQFSFQVHAHDAAA